MMKQTCRGACGAGRAFDRGAWRSRTIPNRLIKIMQGFPPGGNVDIIARILAP